MSVLNIVKKFMKIMDKKQRLQIVGIAIMMVVGAFLETLGVSMIMPVVLIVMQPGITQTNPYAEMACDILNIHSEQIFLIVVVLVLIAVFIIKGLFLLIEYYIQYRFVYNNRINTQKRLLSSYLYKPYEFYLNINSSEILQNVNENVNATFTALIQVLGFFTEIVVMFFLIITILIIDPLMTLLISGVLIFLGFFLITVIKPLLRQEGKNKQKYGEQASKWLLQSIHGLKEVKVSRREEYFLKNFESNGKRVVEAERKNAVLGSIPRILIESLSVSAMLLSIVIMICIGKEANAMLPSLSAFAMAAVRLMPSANRILTYMNVMAYYEPAMDKLLSNLSDIYEKEEKSCTVGNIVNNRKLTLKKEVKLKGIDYHYPNTERYIFRNANMCIPVGSSVGIVGASGAGKTTIIDIMLGLLTPQGGQVLSDGINIQDFYKEWLSHIGYIPQTIFMLDDSIRNNVAFGLEEGKIDDDKVWKALDEAQLAGYIHTLPEGLDTTIGESGVRFSGGQRQRIGIARALYFNPDILVFDEATSALDNETEIAIVNSINNLRGKRTMVIIAHRLQTIEGCDIVYRVEDGVIKRER